MPRLICAAAFVSALLGPSAASAAVIASASLNSGPVSVDFSHDVTDSSGELFSTASASLGPDGVVTADNNPLPGIADAPEAVDGPMSADSFFSVQAGDTSFMSQAGGEITGAGFGSAIGEVTGSFEFFNPEDDLSITIMADFFRAFDLATDFSADLASGGTSLSLALLNDVGFFLPVILLSNAACDMNAAFSVADGDSFSDSCSTSATFTFEDLPAGAYTLTFASNSSVDIVSEVPIPAAFGLFGLGLGALGWNARRKQRSAAA